MDIRTGTLVLTLLVGCIASERDLSIFFRTSVDSRIVNGSPAPHGSHPHIVALTTGYNVQALMCGASLISQRTILTAAHCIDPAYRIYGSLPRSLLARVGSNSWDSGGATYNIERNITHPNYVVQTTKNDIALLITITPVALNDLVRIVPISSSFIPQGVPAKIAGWGQIGPNGPISTNLMELMVTTVGPEECMRLVSAAAIQFGQRVYTEPHIELCTYLAPDYGTCRADSGGPLTLADNGQQIGVVSWGFPCARGVPDMFTRLSAFQTWIQYHLV